MISLSTNSIREQATAYCVSKKHWDEKPPKDSETYYQEDFEIVRSNIDGLRDYLANGYAVSPNMRKLEIAEKSPMNLVFVDIDDSPYDIYTCIDMVKYKPSIYYRSYNDGILGNRYRFVYLFDTPFIGSQFKDVYHELTSELKKVDKRVVNQFYFGTNHTVYTTDYLYRYQPTSSNSEQPSKPNTVGKKYNNSIPYWGDDVFNKSFKEDFASMPTPDFIMKYRDVFGKDLLDHTPYIDNGDERCVWLPDNYLETPRRVFWSRKGHCYYSPKWKDGEKRHKKIFVAGIIYRKLNPDITFEEMVWALQREVYGRYEIRNTINVKDDGPIKFTPSYLMSIANAAMKADITNELKPLLKNMPKFKVSTQYCMLHHLQKNSVANSIKAELRRQNTYNDIDIFYVPELTDAENLSILEENGVKISLSTLKRYRKDRGYLKNKKQKVSSENVIPIPPPIIISNDTFEVHQEIKEKKHGKMEKEQQHSVKDLEPDGATYTQTDIVEEPELEYRFDMSRKINEVFDYLTYRKLA